MNLQMHEYWLRRSNTRSILQVVARRTVQVLKSYTFLREHSASGAPFSVEELCKATGWKPATPTAYLTKKWRAWVREQQGEFYAEGLQTVSEDEYLAHMSQVAASDADNEEGLANLAPDVARLVTKAREAMVLAVEVYNRPATTFKTEAFLVLAVIAWRSLLHAVLHQRGVDVTYRKADGTAETTSDGDDRVWDLRRCLKEFHGTAFPAARRNVEFLATLRDKVEHRYAPAIDAHVAGECQACVINFESLMVAQLGSSFALRDTMAPALQTSHLRTGEQAKAMKAFQGNHYDELMEFIDVFRSSLNADVYEDPQFSFRVYLIPKVGNHESSSDISMEFVPFDQASPEDRERLAKHATLIREKHVPVANAGLFKPSGVASKVSASLGIVFSVNLHTKAWKFFGVRQPGEEPGSCNIVYCQFDTVHRDYIYTQAWVDKLVGFCSDSSNLQQLKDYQPLNHEA